MKQDVVFSRKSHHACFHGNNTRDWQGLYFILTPRPKPSQYPTLLFYVSIKIVTISSRCLMFSPLLFYHRLYNFLQILPKKLLLCKKYN